MSVIDFGDGHGVLRGSGVALRVQESEPNVVEVTCVDVGFEDLIDETSLVSDSHR